MNSLKLLNNDYIEDIRSAVTKMHGSERRSFMAEMTLKHCGGNPRRAETVFGWSRTAGWVRNAQESSASERNQPEAAGLYGKKNILMLLMHCVRWQMSIRSRIRHSEAPSRIHA